MYALRRFQESIQIFKLHDLSLEHFFKNTKVLEQHHLVFYARGIHGKSACFEALEDIFCQPCLDFGEKVGEFLIVAEDVDILSSQFVASVYQLLLEIVVDVWILDSLDVISEKLESISVSKDLLKILEKFPFATFRIHVSLSSLTDLLEFKLVDLSEALVAEFPHVRFC
jgi:hypothetical protein